MNDQQDGFLPPHGNYRELLSYKKDESFETYREFVATRPAESVANIALCLVHQANYLLDRQIRRLEKDFLAKGGLRENMTRARIAHRRRNPE